MLQLASGAEIPRVILGTSRLGGVLPEFLTPSAVRARGFQALDAAVEAGCPSLDIAASYQIGGTERVIGAWMKARRNRDELFLISKGGHPLPVLRPNRLTPTAVSDDLHASLRRLGTDRLDLYLLHRDHPAAALEPLLHSLAAHQREGKIRAYGVSNWTHTRIARLDDLARGAGLPPVAASSPHFSLAEWQHPPWKGCVSIAGEAGSGARLFYERTQLPVLAYSPLGRGFFGTAQARHRSVRDSVYSTAKNLAKRERADILAQRYRTTASKIALSYLFHQPFPVYAIVAASTVEHIRDNLQAVSLRLTADEVRWLETGEGG
jgi:aryl-alcohol dehydrogenase-like predicted oxidoreductase